MHLKIIESPAYHDLLVKEPATKTNSMPQSTTDPLHGITLKAILEKLYEHYGWEELSNRIRINCFYENPSINSSLKFLRKTPWARTKVEELYIDLLKINN